MTGSRCASEIVCTHLPLSHAIDRVDVVQALGAVQIALVDAVDTHEARAALRGWRLAHADGRGLGGPGLGQHHALSPIGRAVAQVVQVPNRDRAQALESRVAEDIALAAQHAGRGRARHRAHGTIDLGQQRHISTRVAPRKGVRRRAVILDQALAGVPARDQPRDLGAAVATQPLQIAQHRPAMRARQLAVIEAPQHGFDPRVAPLVILGLPELQRLGPLQHLPNLFQGPNLGFVHVDHHRLDDRLAALTRCPSAAKPPRPDLLQAHISLESRARPQAHTSLDKTKTGSRAARRATLHAMSSPSRFFATFWFSHRSAAGEASA